MVIDLARQTLWQTLLLGGPPLLVALLVGTAVSFLQAITQIQDSTISLIPKMVAVFLTLALCLPWFIDRLLDFAQQMFGTAPTFMAGG